MGAFVINIYVFIYGPFVFVSFGPAEVGIFSCTLGNDSKAVPFRSLLQC